MAQQIVLTDDRRQTFTTELHGQSVRVTAWWQPDDEAWYVSLSWLNRVPIISGARLVSDGRPLRGLVTDFAGELVVSGTAAEPGREAWSTTHRLLHLTTEDLAV